MIVENAIYVDGRRAAEPGGQRRDLGGQGSGDGGGPGTGRLLRGAARDHGPEARGGLRAGREPGERLTAEPGPRRGPRPAISTFWWMPSHLARNTIQGNPI